jgi:hypothetical protein
VLRGDAGIEAEVALAPDGERVDGLLAGHIVELGVHDLAVVEVDLSLEAAVRQVEYARLSADADELDDVGEVKLGQRALKGHGRVARLQAPRPCVKCHMRISGMRRAPLRVSLGESRRGG